MKEWIKKLSWSKILLLLLFINFFALEVFTGFITLKTFSIATTIGTMDFTPLITLIGAVIGQTISYGIYMAKAKAENVMGGLTYDSAMFELQKQYEEVENNECN